MTTERPPVRVLVADDEPRYREAVVAAVSAQPGFELVGEAAAGGEVIDTVRQLQPQVVLVDVDMRGLDLIGALERRELAAAVMIVSTRLDVNTVYTAVEAGAKAYLSKEASPAEICDAIVGVARGDVVLPMQLQLALARELQSRSEQARPLLSKREHEVLVLISQRFTPYDVCRRLYLSQAALQRYVEGFCEKLGVTEVDEAVTEGRRRGLIR